MTNLPSLIKLLTKNNYVKWLEER